MQEGRVSRYEIYKGTRGLAFGTDHACGDYIQIWDTSMYREPDDDNIIIDEDQKLTGLTKERFLSIIKEHGFTEEDIRSKLKES